MKAIILSAGQGRRLLPLTALQPKAAVAVGTRSVLEWQLREIGRCKIEEVIVVTGFGADHIDAIVERQQYVKARTFYNPFFASCDNLGTCWVAQHEMTAPFMIINGDTLFEAAILQRLLADRNNAPVCLVTDSKADYDDDDMKVIADDGLLRRVGKTIEPAKVNAESIGMMTFDERGAQRFRDILNERMRADSGVRQWYLSVIDQLADEEIVKTCPIDGLSWCEIDDPDDLDHAANVVQSWHGDLSESVVRA